MYNLFHQHVQRKLRRLGTTHKCGLFSPGCFTSQLSITSSRSTGSRPRPSIFTGAALHPATQSALGLLPNTLVGAKKIARQDITSQQPFHTQNSSTTQGSSHIPIGIQSACALGYVYCSHRMKSPGSHSNLTTLHHASVFPQFRITS